MLNIKDINHKPDIGEISAYIKNPLFDKFYRYMLEEYKALSKIEYSKDTLAMGWNIKLRKAGKSLCVIYPKEKHFTVLVVVGAKEKASAEALPLSEEMKKIYNSTREGNGQRWLMIDVDSENALYQDILKLIKIRRESR